MATFNIREYLVALGRDYANDLTPDGLDWFADVFTRAHTEALAINEHFDKRTPSLVVPFETLPLTDFVVRDDCYLIHHEVVPYIYINEYFGTTELGWRFLTSYFDPQTMCGDYDPGDGWTTTYVSTHRTRSAALDAATLAAATLAGYI